MADMYDRTGQAEQQSVASEYAGAGTGNQNSTANTSTVSNSTGSSGQSKGLISQWVSDLSDAIEQRRQERRENISNVINTVLGRNTNKNNVDTSVTTPAADYTLPDAYEVPDFEEFWKEYQTQAEDYLQKSLEANKLATDASVQQIQNTLTNTLPKYGQASEEAYYAMRRAEINNAAYNAANGNGGGLGEKQYAEAEAAYDAKLLSISLEQQSFENECNQQIANLEAQGRLADAQALASWSQDMLAEYNNRYWSVEEMKQTAQQVNFSQALEARQYYAQVALNMLDQGILTSDALEVLGITQEQANKLIRTYNTNQTLGKIQTVASIFSGLLSPVLNTISTVGGLAVNTGNLLSNMALNGAFASMGAFSDDVAANGASGSNVSISNILTPAGFVQGLQNISNNAVRQQALDNEYQMLRNMALASELEGYSKNNSSSGSTDSGNGVVQPKVEVPKIDTGYNVGDQKTINGKTYVYNGSSWDPVSEAETAKESKDISGVIQDIAGGDKSKSIFSFLTGGGIENPAYVDVYADKMDPLISFWTVGTDNPKVTTSKYKSKYSTMTDSQKEAVLASTAGMTKDEYTSAIDALYGSNKPLTNEGLIAYLACKNIYKNNSEKARSYLNQILGLDVITATDYNNLYSLLKL